jgi:methanogenic corrinoid protein MtbC1
MEQTELYKRLADAVVNMDEEKSVELANQVVELGFDAYEAIDKELAKGMEQVCKNFFGGGKNNYR